jgi:hypothetical protein
MTRPIETTEYQNGSMMTQDSRMAEMPVTDLHLAAYLYARGYALLRLEGPGERAAYVFESVPREQVMTFYRGTPLVDARTLFNALRDLKALLRQPRHR